MFSRQDQAGNPPKKSETQPNATCPRRGRESNTRELTEVQTVTLRPLRQCSPKKRKVVEDVTLYLSEDEFADAFEKIADKVLERLGSQKTTNASVDGIDLLRNEVQNSIKEAQTYLTQLFRDAMGR